MHQLLESTTADTALSKKDLIDAIRRGLIDRVKIYTQDNISWLTSTLTEKQQFALHVAATCPSQEVLLHILTTLKAHDVIAMQQHINQKDQHGFTPLMYAVRSGSAPAQHVKYLLEHGADINAQCQPGNQTAMHWAVIAGNQEKIDTLLEYGANLRLKDINGKDAPSLTFANGKNLLRVKIKSLVKVIDHAYEKEDAPDLQPFAKYWPLFTVTLTQKNENILHLLAPAQDNLSLLSYVLNILKSHVDTTTLHTLVNQYDDNGMTPLHYMIDENYDDIELCRLLLDHGANIDAQTLKENTSCTNNQIAKGTTALLLATLCKSLDQVALLLKRNANSCIPDADGRYAYEILGYDVEYLVLKAGKSILKNLMQQLDVSSRDSLQKQSNLLSLLEVVIIFEADVALRHTLLEQAVLILPYEYLFNPEEKLSILLQQECNLSFIVPNDIHLLCHNVATFLESKLDPNTYKARIQLFLVNLIAHIGQQKIPSNKTEIQVFLTQLINDACNATVVQHAPVAIVQAPLENSSEIEKLQIHFCHAISKDAPKEYFLAQFVLSEIYKKHNSSNEFMHHAQLIEFATAHKNILIEFTIEFGMCDALKKLGNDIPAADQQKNLINFTLTRQFINQEIRNKILQILLANGANFSQNDNEQWPWQLELPDGTINPIQQYHYKLGEALQHGNIHTVSLSVLESINWLKIPYMDPTLSEPDFSLWAIHIAINYDQLNMLLYLARQLGWISRQASITIKDEQHWINQLTFTVIKYDAINIFQHFIAQGINLNRADFKTNQWSACTLLHCAAIYNSKHIIDVLLQDNPSLLAVRNGEERLSLQLRYDYIYKYYLPSNTPLTPQHTAAAVDECLNAVKDTLNQEAHTLECAIRNGDSATVTRYAQKIYWLLIPLNIFQQNALHIAACANQSKILTLILQIRKQALVDAIEQGNLDLVQQYARLGTSWFMIPLNSTQQCALEICMQNISQTEYEQPELRERKRAVATFIQQQLDNAKIISEVDTEDYFGITPCQYLMSHPVTIETMTAMLTCLAPLSCTANDIQTSTFLVKICIQLRVLLELLKSLHVDSIEDSTITKREPLLKLSTFRVILWLQQASADFCRVYYFLIRSKIINIFLTHKENHLYLQHLTLQFPKLWDCLSREEICQLVDNVPMLVALLEHTPELIHHFINSSQLKVLFEKIMNAEEKCFFLAALIIKLPLELSLQYYDVLMEFALQVDAQFLNTTITELQTKKIDYENFSAFLHRHASGNSASLLYIAQLMQYRLEANTVTTAQNTADDATTTLIQAYSEVPDHIRSWYYIQAQWKITLLCLKRSKDDHYKEKCSTTLEEVIDRTKEYIRIYNKIDVRGHGPTVEKACILLKNAQYLRDRLDNMDKTDSSKQSQTVAAAAATATRSTATAVTTTTTTTAVTTTTTNATLSFRPT